MPEKPLDISELIPESEVESKFPGIFAKGELRRLRNRRVIACYQVTAQRVFYHPDDIRAYLTRFYRRAEDGGAGGGTECHESDCLSTAASGSPPNPAAAAGIDIGSMAAESAAASYLLARSTPQKRNSSPSQSKRRPHRAPQSM